MCLVAGTRSRKLLPLLLLQLLSLCLQERVELARYCHLPVGNMTGDWILTTADALYARCLRDADYLLWANDPSLPDVAGPANAQVDTARFLLDQPTMEVCCCVMKLMTCAHGRLSPSLPDFSPFSVLACTWLAQCIQSLKCSAAYELSVGARRAPCQTAPKLHQCISDL